MSPSLSFVLPPRPFLGLALPTATLAPNARPLRSKTSLRSRACGAKPPSDAADANSTRGCAADL